MNNGKHKAFANSAALSSAHVAPAMSRQPCHTPAILHTTPAPSETPPLPSPRRLCPTRAPLTVPLISHHLPAPVRGAPVRGLTCPPSGSHGPPRCRPASPGHRAPSPSPSPRRAVTAPRAALGATGAPPPPPAARRPRRPRTCLSTLPTRRCRRAPAAPGAARCAHARDTRHSPGVAPWRPVRVGFHSLWRARATEAFARFCRATINWDRMS